MTDYKNTPEGKKTAEKYADIIHAKRPDPIRPRMYLVQRAKIFAPYDALRGYDEAIEAVNEKAQEVKRPVLSEESLEVLSAKLAQVKKGMRVTLTCFRPGSSADQGTIADLTGIVKRIDPVYRELSITAGDSSFRESDGNRSEGGRIEKELPVVIRFDDLLDVTSPDIPEDPQEYAE